MAAAGKGSEAEFAALQEEIAALKARLKDLAGQGRAKAEEMLSEDQKATVERLSKQLGALDEELAAQVKAHPIGALAVAFGLGMLVARALR
jgi:flagellin-like hook-associated protein FlgL